METLSLSAIGMSTPATEPRHPTPRALRSLMGAAAKQNPVLNESALKLHRYFLLPTRQRTNQRSGFKIILPFSVLHLPYLITLSARTSTFGGIVRPICLAAFKLTTNSNFIGCSTGRSAGVLPFKILSTYVAARRSKSKLFTP